MLRPLVRAALAALFVWFGSAVALAQAPAPQANPSGPPVPALTPPSPAAAPLPPLGRALREFLVDLRPAFNLLVLKTPPSGAQPLAAALDAEKFKEVAGTIAGDDTVLVITPSRQARAAVQKRMEDLLR